MDGLHRTYTQVLAPPVLSKGLVLRQPALLPLLLQLLPQSLRMRRAGTPLPALELQALAR